MDATPTPPFWLTTTRSPGPRRCGTPRNPFGTKIITCNCPANTLSFDFFFFFFFLGAKSLVLHFLLIFFFFWQRGIVTWLRASSSSMWSCGTRIAVLRIFLWVRSRWPKTFCSSRRQESSSGCKWPLLRPRAPWLVMSTSRFRTITPPLKSRRTLSVSMVGPPPPSSLLPLNMLRNRFFWLLA